MRARWALVVVMVLLAAACGDAGEQAAGPAPPAKDPAPTSSVQPPPPTTVPPTTPPVVTTTTIEPDTSVIGEEGSWITVTISTDVVRATVDSVAAEPLGACGWDYPVGTVTVTEPILGDLAAGDTLTVAFTTDVAAGDEAIYFLAPLTLAMGVVAPYMMVQPFEEAGVIREDLDRYAAILPDAADLLGRYDRHLAPTQDEIVAETSAVVAIDGAAEVGRGDDAGWPYVDVQVRVLEVRAGWAQPGAEVVVRMSPGDAAAVLATEGPQLLALSFGCASWGLAGGTLDALPPDVVADLGNLQAEATERASAAHRALDFDVNLRVRELFREHGPIPEYDEATLPGPVLSPEEYSERVRRVQASPLVVDQGAVVVIFDQWFFSTFDRAARVEVRRDGVVVAEGLVAGEDAIMSQDADGTFLFHDSAGAVVATISQEELTAAANAAMEAGGVRVGG